MFSFSAVSILFSTSHTCKRRKRGVGAILSRIDTHPAAGSSGDPFEEEDVSALPTDGWSGESHLTRARRLCLPYRVHTSVTWRMAPISSREAAVHHRVLRATPLSSAATEVKCECSTEHRVVVCYRRTSPQSTRTPSQDYYAMAVLRSAAGKARGDSW